jgi:hypothetical protein
MNLHEQAREDVRDVLAAHGVELGQHVTCFDLSVQEAGGYWEDPNPDLANVDPGIRSGHFRQFAAGLAARAAQVRAGKPTLRLRLRSMAGYHLLTPDGQKIRVRMRPVSGRSRRPMRATASDSELTFDYDLTAGRQDPGPGERGEAAAPGVLFGYDPSARPYEISVLLEVDLGTKTLASAWLAAIDWGKDDRGKMIYYEEQIPAVPLDGTGQPGGGTAGTPGPQSPAGLGFEEFLKDEGEETGSGPA